MRVAELGHRAPAWLRTAQVADEDVEITADGEIVWRGGTWRGGVWWGGDWHWGEWLGGTWYVGTWRGPEDRLLYHAALIGIVFDAEGWATAYRTTQADGRGRYSVDWVQPEGVYLDPDAAPAGAGTCVPGIHITSAGRAWTYFGVDPSCQFWRVRFRREDLLDCDGEKARILGGEFTRIARPF
jgi:hypothetical protein